jgi:uncharacterized protein (TIGR02996 family)
MVDFFPLLIGDEVRPVRGRYTGRTGRVSAIEPDIVRVYFGERREEHPDGSLSISTEADELPPKDLLFRGRPASESILRPALCAASPPREPGLEASVMESIWDDTTRLVYADWLEERGDPHAEYLRVQVALGRAVRAGEPFEATADRERRLRALLNPEWVSRFRRLTTQPPPFDVAALDPAYAAHARRTIRLHPRAGDVPELAASKLGGLFLWPADEPWPTAAGLSVDPDFVRWWGSVPADWSAIPLAPLIQLNRRDVPHLAFPAGADLMQVFWCPFMTGEHAPEPFVFWRNSAEVKSPRCAPPEPAKDQMSGCIPRPSRLYPEEVIEYPVSDEVPENDALAQAVWAWAAGWPRPGSSYGYWWNRCAGWKVGGHPWVNQSDCVRVEAVARDGRPMEYLLQVSQKELNHTNWRWCAVEDRNLCFTGAGGAFVREAGGLDVLSRGNYHLLMDRGSSPWVVRSFHDSAG